MSYSAVARMAYDDALFKRLVAAAAQEGKGPEPVETWVANRRWQIAASPGWAAAWESARAAGDDSPGNRTDVISDPMILSVVQGME